MLKIIAMVGGVVLVLVVVVLGVAAAKPDTFRLQRTTSINATPEKVFALINDFRRWGVWSPYENKDPAMKRAYSGPASGKGAVYTWDGSGGVGQGRMEVANTTPPSKIVIQLDFVKPFETHNIVEFTLESKADSTIVTWGMQGPMPYLAKVVHVFFNMDKVVGGDFETGLANLKAAAES